MIGFLGLRYDTGFQFSLPCTFPLKQLFHHLLVLKAIVLCYFLSGFPLCQHGLHFRLQRLHVCVIPFPHNNTP